MNDSTENNADRKEEILAKSRNSKQDEGKEFVEKKANRIGAVAFGVIALILLVFSVPSQMNVVNTIAALSFAFCIGGCIAPYRFTKKKSYLVGAIASAVAAIAFTLMVILPTLV
jgi:hypothetical protein